MRAAADRPIRRVVFLATAALTLATALGAAAATGGRQYASVLSTVRINAGGGAYTSGDGRAFSADQYFTQGATGDTFASSATIAGTSDQALYKDERWGSFSYAIPVANGIYDVTFHFVELYYRAAPCAGKRNFGMDIRDTAASPDISNLDVCAEAGGANTALVKKVSNVNVSDGILDVQSVYGSVDDPELAAIEVVPAATQPPPPPPAPTVTAKTPADTSTGIATSATPTATFSRAMDASTVTSSSFTLSSSGGTAAASVRLDTTGTTATLTPNAALAPSTSYTARLGTTIKATDGTPLAAAVTWSFTTAAAPPVPAAPAVTIDLCAKAGTATMPGGVTVPIWGFARKPSGVDCTDSSVVAQLPGPLLDVNAGDSVVLRVTNALSGRSISVEAPGVSFDPGPTDAAPGATVSLTFTASAPGTYLYESGGDAGRQEAMGLYGALLVRSPTPGQAYAGAASAYDVERVLVLSEIDPALNANPDSFDMLTWKPTYWLINGKAYPQTDAIDVHPGQRLLLRYLNAGIDNNTMTLLGTHQRLIARDAYALNNPFDVVSETFPSGETADAIATIPSGSAGASFPLYNRQLHITNGANINDPSYSPGGMLTFLRVS